MMEQDILQQILQEIKTLSAKQASFEEQLNGFATKQTTFGEQLDGVAAKQTTFGEQLDGVAAKQTTFGEQLDGVATKQHELKIIVENENKKSIKSIAEGHSILNDKLDKIIELEKTVNRHEDRIGALEYKVKNA